MKQDNTYSSSWARVGWLLAASVAGAIVFAVGTVIFSDNFTFDRLGKAAGVGALLGAIIEILFPRFARNLVAAVATILGGI